MSVRAFEAQAASVPSFNDLQSQLMPLRDVNAQQEQSADRASR